MSINQEIHGFVAPGFAAVADEFERNFTERNELGAAFAVHADGVPIVDLWGGLAARSLARPWQHDTVQTIFSGTKGLVAVCVLILLERGRLDLDTPAAAYWPEFAAAGKGHILVRHLVSHMAGLPGVRAQLQVADLVDHERLAALLAAQEPLLPPGEVVCYHPFTYGWLCGELVRRVDGRSIGRFFAEEVAEPLGLELWIGLPASIEDRVATLELASDWGSQSRSPAAEQDHDSLIALADRNPPLFDPGSFPWNSRTFHEAEIPGAGAIGTARSIARLYGCLARGGELDGFRLISESTLLLGRAQLSRGLDPRGGDPLAFGVGFALQTERLALGPPADAFGHGGAGGSMHGAWPRQRVGFSYAMNRMRDDQAVDPRMRPLLQALHRSVLGGLTSIHADSRSWRPDG